MKRIISFTLLSCFLLGCEDRELRGYVEKSPDGETYLVVQDDNGGQCGPMILNGQNWPHAIGKPGKVNPGEHFLECGGGMSFTVKEGTTFYVDYWGP